ncbi:MAG TPA: hypothetical protein VK694_00730 [Verrucomicrobiae bacterium]|nr:hypothetical protein [Verrucomicrobiae bacterium]
MKSNEKSDSLSRQEFHDFSVRLFRYLDERFDRVDKRFEELEGKFSNLQTTVDSYAKQVEVYHQESIARDAHVDRLQRWIEQVAQKTGIKLEY